MNTLCLYKSYFVSYCISFSGKGVFSEKPIADTVEDIRECYAKAVKAQKPLLCSFNR